MTIEKPIRRKRVKETEQTTIVERAKTEEKSKRTKRNKTDYNLIAPSIEGISNALYFIQKARVASQVRQKHLAKRDEVDPITNEFKEKTLALEEWLNGIVRDYVCGHPAYYWFSRVKGIGDLNIGKVVSLVDIEKCPTISSLWRFAMGAPMPIGEDGKSEVEKRKRGAGKIHYNSTLKSMMWRLGKSLIRAGGAFIMITMLKKRPL